MNRIHTISVPYAVMKACPLSWVQRVHIHKGNRSPEAPVWLKPTNMVVSVAEQLGSLWWNVATCTGPWWLIGSRGTSAWRRYGCSSLLMVQIPVSVPDSRFIHINFTILNVRSCPSAGSVSSCDAFLNVFQSHGLKPEVICPCATSPEAMTVAIRRYPIIPDSWRVFSFMRLKTKMRITSKMLQQTGSRSRTY